MKYIVEKFEGKWSVKHCETGFHYHIGASKRECISLVMQLNGECLGHDHCELIIH